MPVPWNFRFQSAAGGIQTSKWISEWLAGLDIASTRQNSARLMDFAAPGGVNAPAETSTADVTVVFGMISLVRLEHVGAAEINDGTTEQAAQRNNRVRRVPPGRISVQSFRHPAGDVRESANSFRAPDAEEFR